MEDTATRGPGEYVPDTTEGITRVEDLPKTRIERRSRNYKARRCPRCGARAGRYATATRTLRDLGDLRAGHPIDLVVTVSRHHCPHCDLFFPADTSDLARPKCQYTRRVQRLAVRLVAEDGLPYRTAQWHLWRDHRVFVPWATIQNWVEAAGGKKLDTLQTTYLDEALAGFSGYLAVDEPYDGPCCVPSVVDNRRYHRLAFRVLGHKPSHPDVRAFLTEFKAELDRRGLVVKGVTTDGSPLYPRVLKELWPKAGHQVCRFHVLIEITKAVLRALAKLRKQIKAQIPRQKRGRPGKADQARMRRVKRLRRRVAELFEHRHLFVKHYLSAAEKKVLKRLTRGQPALQALRAIMDEVYRLFDRRRKTATALGLLEKLRRRLRRFKRLGRTPGKLHSPALEKALEFLDDKLLGSTSNAVERSNRRYRKAQKTIYRVRTKRHREQRITLDRNRELRAGQRALTLKTLHRVRSDPDSGHC